MADKLGLKSIISMGIGGVVGGGIFAALGVAAEMAGNAAFISYLLAGAVAMASGYSYVKMTEHFHEEGGSFTFLEHYLSNDNIAGMVGWILITGYIGTMAMYAYAFGSFSSHMLGLEQPIFRKILSAAVIALFLAINLAGKKALGESENLLVYFKVAVLTGFGLIASAIIISSPGRSFFAQGIFNHGFSNPIIAIGAIFVSFEGWQLLTYEYSDIKDIETLKKGVVATIAASTLIYVLISVVTTSLVSPEMIITHKETVLAFAAQDLFSNPLITKGATAVISLAALFSTASAINATLFGTARFSYKISTEKDLPQVFSFKNQQGIPTHSLIITGFATVLLALIGSLEAITTFASISFAIVFGVVNLICWRDREVDTMNWVPELGVLGIAAVLILEVYHLYTEQRHLLVFVSGIYLAVVLAEYLYFERNEIEKEIEQAEEEINNEEEKIEEEIEEVEDEL